MQKALHRTHKWTIGNVVIGAVLIFFAFLCLIPFYYIFMVSFSDPTLVKEGHVILLPKGFSLRAYSVIFNDRQFFTGFRVSVLRTVFGTIISLSVQCMFAYAISRRHMAGRKILLGMIVFAVLFNGGMIPTFLIVRYTGILDTLWALMLPGSMNPWNVIVLTSFFLSIPLELEESAVIDGANDWRIFTRIALPLSIPSIATIALFIAVAQWNSLLDSVIYINSSRLKPLQVYLVDLVMRANATNMVSQSEQDLPLLSIQTAAIFASTLPILIVYPFVQRFFVKGVMIGAIKG